MDVFLYQELLVELTKREIKQRYKQSLLGYAWVLLNPLTQMMVMALVFSRILPVSNLGVPYPVFLYVGLLPWTLFSSSLSASANSLIDNAKLITKIYLPRTVFIQSMILAKMVDFFLATSLLFLLILYFQIPLTFSILWFVPIFCFQTLFTYGLSLLISSLNIFYRDIQYLLNFLLMVWMYVTPIIYPPSFFPSDYQWVFRLNPIAVFITAYRAVILEGTSPNFMDLGLSLMISVFMYCIAITVFKKLDGRFADAL